MADKRQFFETVIAVENCYWFKAHLTALLMCNCQNNKQQIKSKISHILKKNVLEAYRTTQSWLVSQHVLPSFCITKLVSIVRLLPP